VRVSEIYASVQGEGPRTGQTTVFVRFGGCNLRCPGWPCDTQHAIDPAYRHTWERWSPEDLTDRVEEVAYKSGAHLITLTGGEPFLQRDSDLEYFCTELRARGYAIEAFTNGTLPYPKWALTQTRMIVDWKLPGSGEFTASPETRITNLQALCAAWPDAHAVKFVCMNRRDFEQAVHLYKTYHASMFGLIWYYGRVWDGEVTNAELAEWVMTEGLPWRLNVQLHNYVWPAHERGR